MTSNNYRATTLVILLALGLSGCGEGSSEEGIRVTAQTTYLTSDTAAGDPDAVTDPAHTSSARKPFYRDDNMYIELQLGLLNLQATRLIPCESIVASAASGLLNFVFPAAHAHAAHIPSGPAGIIDVLKPDLLVWDLGELAAQAGSYCGVELATSPVLSHGEASGHHTAASEAEAEAEEEEAFDMSGKSAVVSPCYYPDTAGEERIPKEAIVSPAFGHSCIDVTFHGEAAGTVLFAKPLSLSADNLNARLMLATLYDSWFNGLDMTILADDHDEQVKLAENILDSFYVYSLE